MCVSICVCVSVHEFVCVSVPECVYKLCKFGCVCVFEYE